MFCLPNKDTVLQLCWPSFPRSGGIFHPKVRANAQQPRLFVGMILILIFAEALGLYGLIVGLVVASTATEKGSSLNIFYGL